MAEGNISVTATVLPARYIYIDQTNKITSIAANTSSNIDPVVIKAGQTVSETSSVAAQYQQIQAYYGSFNLGKTYYPPSRWQLALKHVNLYVSKIY